MTRTELRGFLQKFRVLPNGKNNKLMYYVRSTFRSFVPNFFLEKEFLSLLKDWEARPDAGYIRERVDYYNKLSSLSVLPPDTGCVGDIRNIGSVYYRDSYEVVRYFDKSLKIATAFGDNTSVPKFPAICKSRPIEGDVANAVLLNLDKVRHFIFLKDTRSFEDKFDKAIFRGAIYQPQRIRFMEKYFGHPLVDCGDTGHSVLKEEWRCHPISLYDHLAYKFIVALEGNDVASNLKWIMSSNSVAVMPKPRFETWFMEGRLIPNYHYIEIRSDYTDLPEKINYYSEHPNEAKEIAQHANDWCRQFFNKKRERLIALLVMNKYFKFTCQK